MKRFFEQDFSHTSRISAILFLVSSDLVSRDIIVPDGIPLPGRIEAGIPLPGRIEAEGVERR